MTMDAAAAKKQLDKVLAIAKKAAPGAEVSASLGWSRSANTRFARSELTSNGDVTQTTLDIAVAFGKREASVSTNQLDETSVRVAIDQAARLAKLSPEDPERQPVLGPQKYMTVKGAFDKPTAGLGAVERATAAASAIDAGTAAKLEIAGFYEHTAASVARATSAGLYAFHSSTNAEFSTTCRTADGTGSGWAGAWSKAAANIDTRALAGIAADKAVRSAKPRALPPGKYQVVLEPAAVGELLGFLSDSMSRRSADEGRSYFSKPGGGTRLGEKVLPEHVTLTSDPADPDLPTAPFAGDGWPLAKTTWIDKGTITNLGCSRFWAAKNGLTPLGRPGALRLAGGKAASVEELVKGVKKGVLITRFWYTRWVDPRTMLITGLTRDGVFLIENGAITAPVNNFRFNESPLVMLGNSDAMTSRVWETPGLMVPALRTDGFNLASVSDAV
jgi:predicted Zn-dependent protease